MTTTGWARIEAGYYAAYINGRRIEIVNMAGQSVRYMQGPGAYWLVHERIALPKGAPGKRYPQLAACWTFKEAKQWVADNIANPPSEG